VSVTVASQADINSELTHPMVVSEVSSNITLTGTVQGTVQISLHTGNGREVYRTRKIVRPGANSLEIPSNLNRNQLLILHITDGRWNYSKQIVLH